MVCANYCAPYPKQPYIRYVVNIWYDITYSRAFYFLLSSSVIDVVTTPLDVTDVTDLSNPNPRVLKIEKYKIIQEKIKIRNKIK